MEVGFTIDSGTQLERGDTVWERERERERAGSSNTVWPEFTESIVFNNKWMSVWTILFISQKCAKLTFQLLDNDWFTTLASSDLAPG